MVLESDTAEWLVRLAAHNYIAKVEKEQADKAKASGGKRTAGSRSRRRR